MMTRIEWNGQTIKLIYWRQGENLQESMSRAMDWLMSSECMYPVNGQVGRLQITFINIDSEDN